MLQQPDQSITSGYRVTAADARRLFELTEPIAVVAYSEQVNAAVMALGLRGTWDAYFAGRAAPLGRDVPASVVHALFYNFADGEVARHLPRVWHHVSPAAANAAREQASVSVLRRALGDLAGTAEVSRAAELLLRAGTRADTEGRALYAAVRTLPLPETPLARLWHGANLLREHRGDGHNAALLAAGIGGTESHVLRCLASGEPPAQDGRVWHLPPAHVEAVVDGMRGRGLVRDDGRLTPAGHELKRQVEATTDELATSAYAVLDRDELNQLERALEPLAAALV